MQHGRGFMMVALVAVLAMLAMTLALAVDGSQDALAQAGRIIYVDASATGLNTGGSWRNAFTDLQSALDLSDSADQIWMAAGIYKPTRRLVDDDPRSATFQMVNGVPVYGGFKPGLGVTKFEQRDWVTYKTILSGDIGVQGYPADNVYHVFYHSEELGLDNTAVLDGFVIAHGNADQEDPSGLRGGGMLNDHASPTLRNITFLNNSAGYGGALWVSAPVPEEVTVTLTNVAFVNNWAVEGGSVYIDATAARPADVFTFTNCIFRDNEAQRGGGVAVALGELAADTPPIRFTNCTLYGNQAEVGDAFYVAKGPGEGWLAVTNSILWGDSLNQIYVEDGVGPPLVTYSDVQGGYGGEGNLTLDPRFVEPDSGNLHLQPDSPCIDVGDNGAPDLPIVDFEGDSRILDGDVFGPIVDLGVDEFKKPAIPVEISVTPYIPNNIIKPGLGVVVDVAILSTEEFDATEVIALDTVQFAGAMHVGFTFVDVNKDGHDDVLLDFMTEDMEDLNEGSTEATLTGFTLEDVPIEGTDEVKVR